VFSFFFYTWLSLFLLIFSFTFSFQSLYIFKYLFLDLIFRLSMHWFNKYSSLLRWLAPWFRLFFSSFQFLFSSSFSFFFWIIISLIVGRHWSSFSYIFFYSISLCFNLFLWFSLFPFILICLSNTKIWFNTYTRSRFNSWFCIIWTWRFRFLSFHGNSGWSFCNLRWFSNLFCNVFCLWVYRFNVSIC